MNKTRKSPARKARDARSNALPTWLALFVAFDFVALGIALLMLIALG